MNTIPEFAKANPSELKPIDEGIPIEELDSIQEPTLQDVLKKRLANLLSVKSLVTLILTVVFAYQSITGGISQDFMTVYAVVIAFYFGTQSKATNSGGTEA